MKFLALFSLALCVHVTVSDLAASAQTIDEKASTKTSSSNSVSSSNSASGSKKASSLNSGSSSNKTSISRKSAAKTSGPVRSTAAALAIVNAEPDVKKFVALIKKSGRKGSRAEVEFDREEDGDYIIHVYEYVPDDDESGHTATMNWYHVNKKTGKVSKEF